MKQLAIAVVAVVLAASAAPAKTLYLKNGDEVDYESLQRKGGKLTVYVNRETSVVFDDKDVDMARSASDMTPAKPQRQQKAHRRSGGRHHLGAVVPDEVQRRLKAKKQPGKTGGDAAPGTETE